MPKSRPVPYETVHARMCAICLALPDTKETLTWGKPHYRVGEKIFAGCSEEAGKPTVGFKLAKAKAAALVRSDPRATPAPFVGKHGWIQLDASAIRDWEEIRDFVDESYRLIAPKRSVAKMQRSDEKVQRKVTKTK